MRNLGRNAIRTGLAILVITLVSVLSCGSATLPSVRPYYPVEGEVRNLVVVSDRDGGWRVSWTPVPRARRYTVSVDGVQVGTTRGTRFSIPEAAEVRSGRPAPIVSVTPTVNAAWMEGLPWLQSPKRTTALACAPLTFVGVRGSGQNSERDGWGGGMGDRAYNILSATRRILSVGSSVIAAVGVSYPANRADTIDGALTYRQSTQAGIKALRDSLWAWSQECPDTHYILFGYSQGADIIATAWQDLTDESRDAVERVILFGDPHYNSRDPAARNQSAESSGPLGARDVFEDARFSTWCSAGDVVCQGNLGNLFWLRQRVHGERYDEWQEISATELADHVAEQPRYHAWVS